jgi:hypothetical protein
MAAMLTTLMDYQNFGNSYSWRVTGHTTQKPKLVLQRRKLPTNTATGVQEDSFSVLMATVDVDGNVIASKTLFTATVRQPLNAADATELNAAAVIFRDIVASDEFTAMYSSSAPLGDV